MLRRYGFDLIVCIACLSLLGFFGWHGLHGKRSFASETVLLEQVAALEAKRDEIRARRDALEARVTLLRPQSIDPDMLEEMARQMLGFARSNEIVVSD